jgi:polysaccharide biosynthesis/export protein ExoF
MSWKLFRARPPRLQCRPENETLFLLFEESIMMTSSHFLSFLHSGFGLPSMCARGHLPKILSVFLFVGVANIAGSLPASSDTRISNGQSVPDRTSATELEMKYDTSSLVLTIGDKIKVMFLERVGGGTVRDSPQGMNVVERVELTGDYTLQMDGNIYLPILGSQKIGGLGMADAQAELQSSFQVLFGREARVSISILDREPVYVLGKVAKPGTFEYTPGMTVLHALAQAGGVQNADLSEMYDSVRETQHLDQSLEKQKRLQSRLDVLKSERDGMPAVASGALLELAGNEQSASLIAKLVSQRELAGEIRSFRLMSLDSTIKAANREQKIQRERIEHIKSNAGDKAERVALLKQLVAHGNGSAVNYLNAKSEFSDTQERTNEVQSLIAQIEDRLAQAQHEKSRIVTEARIDLEREISEAETSVAEEKMAAAASSQILKLARESNRDAPQRFEDLRYIVVRRTPSGIEELPADETTVLRAGDLVKVQFFGRAAAAKLLIEQQTIEHSGTAQRPDWFENRHWAGALGLGQFIVSEHGGSNADSLRANGVGEWYSYAIGESEILHHADWNMAFP